MRRSRSCTKRSEVMCSAPSRKHSMCRKSLFVRVHALALQASDEPAVHFRCCAAWAHSVHPASREHMLEEVATSWRLLRVTTRGGLALTVIGVHPRMLAA